MHLISRKTYVLIYFGNFPKTLLIFVLVIYIEILCKYIVAKNSFINSPIMFILLCKILALFWQFLCQNNYCTFNMHRKQSWTLSQISSLLVWLAHITLSIIRMYLHFWGTTLDHLNTCSIKTQVHDLLFFKKIWDFDYLIVF